MLYSVKAVLLHVLQILCGMENQNKCKHLIYFSILYLKGLRANTLFYFSKCT